MITTYQLELSARLMPSDGYKLYAWLLTQIPSAAAEALHSQQDHPISQFVTFDKEKDTSIWNIHLLSTEASALFAPAIESIETISLHTGEISVVSKLPKTEIQFEDIIRQARQIASSCMEIQFRSAASFKQNGRYGIFPQEKLILQSLVNRWNSFCEEYPLCDPDALCMLESGIYIRDYTLKSVRYHLKNVYIPAFVGKVTLDSRLPVPLAELWRHPALGRLQRHRHQDRARHGWGKCQISLESSTQSYPCNTKDPQFLVDLLTILNLFHAALFRAF